MVLAQGRKDLGQGIGGVGVVHHHRGPVAAAETLHAPRHRGDAGQALEGRLQRRAAQQEHAEGGQQVGHVEASEQRRAQRALPFGCNHGGLQAFRILRDVPGQQVRRMRWLEAIGERLHTGRELPGQFATDGIVGVQDRAPQPRPAEQAALGFGVAGHVAVVVEMVTAEIGEHRIVEAHPIHPVLIQGVGADFHGQAGGARLAQFGQGAVDADHVWRGVAGGGEIADQATAKGTEHAPGRLDGQGLGEEVAHRGLAVGAGDPGDLQSPGGVGVEAIGNLAELCAQPGHGQHRDGGAALGMPPGQGHRLHARLRFPQRGHGATGDGRVDETGTVHGQAAAGDEQIARHHLPAVGAQTGDGPIGHLGHRQQILQEGAEAETVTGVHAGHHGVASRDGWPSAARRTGVTGAASGATPSRRRAPAITFEKTGAATCPP